MPKKKTELKPEIAVEKPEIIMKTTTGELVEKPTGKRLVHKFVKINGAQVEVIVEE